MTTLEDLNDTDHGRFVEQVAGLYDGAVWLAERAAQRRPYRSAAHLKHTLAELVRNAEADARMSLLKQHRPAPATDDATPEHAQRLQQLAADYRAHFGHAIVVAPGPRGTPLSATELIAECERRLDDHADVERDECLRQLHRIAELRLDDKFGTRARTRQPGVGLGRAARAAQRSRLCRAAASSPSPT